MGNPLFYEFNQCMKLGEISSQQMADSAKYTIEQSRLRLQQIVGVKDGERTFKNTMSALDELADKLSEVVNVIYLLAYTHPDAETRNTAQQVVVDIEKFMNELWLDEQLYAAVKAYSGSDEAQHLAPNRARYLKETVQSFERNGFALPKAGRDQLKGMKDALADLTLQFESNIADVTDCLLVDEAEIEGLPEDYKKARLQADGRYKISLESPSYVPFMKLSVSESARKQLYILYNNRAADQNLSLLLEVLKLRKEMASLLGFSSYAAYSLEDMMAKTSDRVWKFERELAETVKAKALKDYDELLAMKREYTGDPASALVNPWEASFFNNVLLKEKYQVDNEKVKEYFELNKVMDGLFQINEQLFGIRFQEVEQASVYHPDVRYFAVLRDGQPMAHFYLDLYPRENKYSHAACFGLINGRQTEQGYKQPVAALVCNFPKPTDERPSLLTHGDVTTFFHEFGHLMHDLLTDAELSGQAGTSVARDFVETPSQLAEKWAWDYDALKLFASHFETGEPFPRELFDRMWDSQNVGSGIFVLQQIYYGMLDMNLHHTFDPYGTETTKDVARRLQTEVTLYPYVEETNFEASFGHLMGYSAGYYSYLWALVYAEDVFSVFEQQGILNSEVGRRYWSDILKNGGSRDEMGMVTAFLGREPNQEAFLKSLGL